MASLSCIFQSYSNIDIRDFFVGVATLNYALALPEVNIIRSLDSDEVVSSYGVVTTGKYDIKSATKDALIIAPGPTGFVSNFAFEISKHRCYEREMDGLTDKVAY